jgi:hypothetical protein
MNQPKSEQGTFGKIPKSFRKWALVGQNNGALTKRQRAQQQADRHRHELQSLRAFPMHSSSVYVQSPATINSRRSKTRNRKGYPPSVPLMLNNISTSLRSADGKRVYERRTSGQIVRV